MGTLAQTTATSGDVLTGLVKVNVGGTLIRVKGSVKYNLGVPKRELITGQDGHHGFKEVPQEAYLELASTDGKSYDLATLLSAQGVNVTCELNNGKVITYTECSQTGEGDVDTEESEVNFKWTSLNQGVES